MKALTVLLALAASGSAHALEPFATGVDRSPLILDSSQYSVSTTQWLSDAINPGTQWNNTRQTNHVYSHMSASSTFTAMPAATGSIGYDDYVSTTPNSAIPLTSFEFVGGFESGDGLMFVEFFDMQRNFIAGFGIQLPRQGSFNYTIALDSPIMIPGAGVAQISFDDGTFGDNPTTGRWFLSDAPTAVGTDDRSSLGPMSDPRLQQKFALIPAPGVASLLLATGALAAARRRR